VYGAKTTAESVSLGYSDFVKLYRQAGESTLVDLLIDGAASGKVIIQDVQHDPVNDRIIHVDLKRIDMSKKMQAPVELRFVGEAPVIKASGGTLVASVHTVEVECLPQDLVSNIEVSIVGLNSYEDVIKVKDIVLPSGIKILSPQAEDLVVKAAPALTEEQIKAMEEAGAAMDVSKIESAKPEKVDEEGAADGAAAADAKAPAAEAKKDEKKEEKK
jgi:large subunit ribosomal protein L25